MLSKNETPMGPTFKGFIDTTHDALVLFEACKREQCTKITRRLQEKERSLITSGTVFVFDEKEAGIKRWTDGMLWSPSRILGNFLIYRELDKRPVEAASADADAGAASGSSAPPPASSTKAGRSREKSLVGSLTASYRFKADGLVKKTISVSGMHMICYYRVSDVMQGRLRAPATVPELLAFEISADLLINQNFRVPPKIEVGLDGQPRFAGETDSDTAVSSGAPRAAFLPAQYVPAPAPAPTAGPSNTSSHSGPMPAPDQFNYATAPSTMFGRPFQPPYEEQNDHLHPATGLELSRGGSSGSAASDSSQPSQPPSPGPGPDRRPRSQSSLMRPQNQRTISSENHISRRYDPYARTSPLSPNASHAPWSSMPPADYPPNSQGPALAPPSWPPQALDASSVSPFAYNQSRLDVGMDVAQRPYSSGPSVQPFLQQPSSSSIAHVEAKPRPYTSYDPPSDYQIANLQHPKPAYSGQAPMTSASSQPNVHAHMYGYSAERDTSASPGSNAQPLPTAPPHLYQPPQRYSVSFAGPSTTDFRGSSASMPDQQTFYYDAGPLDHTHPVRHVPAPIDTSRPYSAAISSASSGPFYNAPYGFLSPSLAHQQPEQHLDYGRGPPAPYMPTGMVGPSGLPSPTEHFDERRRSSTMLPQPQARSAFPMQPDRRWTFEPAPDEGAEEEVLSPYQQWSYRSGTN